MKLVREHINEEEEYKPKWITNQKTTPEYIRKITRDMSPWDKFQLAVENNIVWLFKEALEEGVHPWHQDNWAIRWASGAGFDEIVKILLEYPEVDPTVRSNETIYQAVWNDHINTVKILLEDGRIDPSYNDNKLLYVSSELYRYDIVKLLLDDKRVMDKVNLVWYERDKYSDYLKNYED